MFTLVSIAEISGFVADVPTTTATAMEIYHRSEVTLLVGQATAITLTANPPACILSFIKN